VIGHDGAVGEWINFLHPLRDDFAATKTEEERAVWREHSARPQQLREERVVVLPGPTLVTKNTRIVVFEAPDEEAATAIMCGDPAVAGGDASGELRPFRVSLLRGRDDAAP